jgi:hypothetical protein
MLRPQLYRSSLTGSLAPDVRDLLLGLTTLCDDEGYMLWEPAEIASYIYSYQPARRRLRDFERRADVLIAAGLIDVKPCGCAYLPILVSYFGIKGGKPTSPIWTWHQRHPNVGERGATGDHDTDSGSSSSFGVVDESGAASSSSRARDGQEATRECEWCHTAFDLHDPMCPNARHLEAVVGQ